MFRKKANSEGFFRVNEWVDKDSNENKHTIGINPELFDEPVNKYCGVLIHQLLHYWQWKYGKNNPSGHYHDKEWRERAEFLDLQLIDIGAQQDKTKGKQITQTIRENSFVLGSL
ncbi:SprT-like domain-containing protein [Trichothermofontia sp.]